MILELLVDQFMQRFRYEKRARVCLWFDERLEFTPILPALHEYLEDMEEPPFWLIEYDASSSHGQVWIKHSIYELREEAARKDSDEPRFVIYLPFPESGIGLSGNANEPSLEMLSEYHIAGTTWRIDGKRPTLFSFLRQCNVELPENVAEQRRLYEGGGNSLLAKYVTKFIDRPREFWSTMLSPELAQSRLVEDIDQIILDLAIDPEETWEELRKKGLLEEFLDAVKKRYGFETPSISPSDWVLEFSTILALTETFIGYHEPADFPFRDRLPALPVRNEHVRLLKRWLRDARSRYAWYSLIEEAEKNIDLSKWAIGRDGLSFGFPHLVIARWRDVLEAFDKASDKASSINKFFKTYGEMISEEAEYAGEAYAHAGSWWLLRDLHKFIASCESVAERIDRTNDGYELARIYVEHILLLERKHVMIRYIAEEKGLPVISRVADRYYANYANSLNSRFFESLVREGTAEIKGLEKAGELADRDIWNAKGRHAAIIVDALRYDCALAIADLLGESDVEVVPAIAPLPTITAVGMTAMLPLAGVTFSVETKGNSLHPYIDGKDMAVRANRMEFLASHGADCRDISDIESATMPTESLGDLLVVFGHDDVDLIGHGDAQALIRHLQIEIERLVRLIRKLHRWGYDYVHVVTDHGFILLDEERLPQEVSCDKSWCRVLKERYAVVSAGIDLPVFTFPFTWDESLRIAIPPGMAFFKAEKSFSHGGASLQEIIVPHLTSTIHMTQERKISVEVLVPSYELMRATVKVTLRPKISNATGQMQFETGRNISIDVLRTDATETRVTVLASGPVEIRLEPDAGEVSIPLFFHSAASFYKGEQLDLEVRDVDTAELLTTAGMKLTVRRDM